MRKAGTRWEGADRRLLDVLHGFGRRRPAVAATARTLSLTGEHAALWLAAGLAAAAADRPRRGAWLRATALTATAHLTGSTLKRLVRRPRPVLPGAPPHGRAAGPGPVPVPVSATAPAGPGSPAAGCCGGPVPGACAGAGPNARGRRAPLMVAVTGSVTACPPAPVAAPAEPAPDRAPAEPDTAPVSAGPEPEPPSAGPAPAPASTRVSTGPEPEPSAVRCGTAAPRPVSPAVPGGRPGGAFRPVVGRYAFPSSHAASAAAAAVAFAAVRPGARWAGVPVAAAMCLSRLVLGVHHPTDVLAGALLGAVTARVGRRWAPTPVQDRFSRGGAPAPRTGGRHG